MKEKFRWAVILILYLTGVGIFAVPDLNNMTNKIGNIRGISGFMKRSGRMWKTQGIPVHLRQIQPGFPACMNR